LDKQTVNVCKKISKSESVSNRNRSPLITGSSQRLSLIGLALAMCSISSRQRRASRPTSCLNTSPQRRCLLLSDAPLRLPTASRQTYRPTPEPISGFVSDFKIWYPD